jgi:hypothetical protein
MTLLTGRFLDLNHRLHHLLFLCYYDLILKSIFYIKIFLNNFFRFLFILNINISKSFKNINLMFF